MTIHFIGAGPGAPDLITIRGLNLIKGASVILYAGSLVPQSIVAEAKESALVKDTASMNLNEIIHEMEKANLEGKDVARIHSGDPSLYGAIAEQIRCLKALKISYDITPGVPAYAAAAAVLQTEFTLPNVSQTVILTRTSTRSSPMPKKEELSKLGKIGATLAIHLSINNISNVVKDLVPHYSIDCPVVVVYRVSWPDQIVIRGSLGNIREKVKKQGITRTALILIGNVFGTKSFDDSRLYAEDFHHILRPRKKAI